MHFNSWLFPVFFGVVYVAYLTLRRHRLQNSWLLLSSLVFYGLWDWRFIAPLLLSGTIDFYVARAMARRPDRRQRLPLLMISLIANLGFLAYFKYLGLFIETAAACAAFLDEVELRMRLAQPRNDLIDGGEISCYPSVMTSFPALVRRQGDFNGLLVDIKTYVHGRIIHGSPPFCGSVFPLDWDIIHDTKDGELLLSVNHCV